MYKPLYTRNIHHSPFNSAIAMSGCHLILFILECSTLTLTLVLHLLVVSKASVVVDSVLTVVSVVVDSVVRSVLTKYFMKLVIR